MANEPIPVNSSWVRSIHYVEGALRVVTKSGRRYTFVGIPHSLWKQLEASDSKGSFINAHIKGRFKEA